LFFSKDEASLANSTAWRECQSELDIYTPRVLNLYGLYSCFLFIVSLIHFSVHIQLSGLVKTLVAAAFALTFALLCFLGTLPHFAVVDISSSDQIAELESAYYGSSPFHVGIVSFSLYTNLFFAGFWRENAVILIDLAFLCLFIWLINRQSEFIYRLSFKCDQSAHLKVCIYFFSRHTLLFRAYNTF
jgi:hypothetical protein